MTTRLRESRLRIQHVNVLVDDLRAATHFYGELLGLEPMDPPDQGFPSAFFRFNDDQQLHVNELPDAKGHRAHFCVVVDDFPAVFRRMKGAGAIDVVPWGKVRRLPSGAMQMFVRDPSGNLLEIAGAPDAPVDEALFDDELCERTPGVFRMEGAR